MRMKKMKEPTGVRRGRFSNAIFGLGVALLLSIMCNPVRVDARAGGKLYNSALSAATHDRPIKENTEMTQQNADEKVKLENPSDAPLIFTEVVLKPYKREGETGNKIYVSFSLTVKNKTDRRITRFAFTQKTDSRGELHAAQQVVVEPNGTKTFLVQIMPKEPSGLTVAMTGVQFEDGTQWGTLPGVPGGKEGLLGTQPSAILNSSQDTLMGKFQKGDLLGATQKDTLIEKSQKDTLFETSQSTLFKAQK